MVAPTCNPSTLGGQGGWITLGQEFKNSQTNKVKPHFYKKYKNYSGVVAAPVIPATLEAEKKVLLEPGRRRLQ